MGKMMVMGREHEPVLSVLNVGHNYAKRTALEPLSFSVSAGELVALIGPNGAGKTTLLSVLADSLKPTQGEVTHAGVGWVPQQPAVYGRLSVRENLTLFARLARVESVTETVQQMLEQTDLVDRADDLVADLSGGNKQRINIAIGLLSSPAVLLLDEPSTALDPRQRERLWGFVQRLAGEGTAVLYSTHYVTEVSQADRVLVLAEGRLLFSGSPEQLIQQAAPGEEGFEAVFMGILERAGC